MVQVYILLEFHFWKRKKKSNQSSVMILMLAYSSSFLGISFAMKDRDSVVNIQSKEKRTRSGSLNVTSIYLYAITISYYSIVRYKNIDNISKGKVIGLNQGRVKLFNIAFEFISMKNVVNVIFRTDYKSKIAIMRIHCLEYSIVKQD